MPVLVRNFVETKEVIVRVVPFMADNFSYLVICKDTLQAMAIDPADPDAMMEALREESYLLNNTIALKTIACTHYHADHAGGNLELRAMLGENGDIDVVGGNESILGRNIRVDHGSTFQVGKVPVEVRAVPCHTMGSVCFFLPRERWLFTGDFLFSAGCGKFFEGSARDFCLGADRLTRDLPQSTLLFPGHEYTKSNLEFASKVNPDNVHIKAQLEHIAELQSKGLASIPTTLARELEINLFLQCASPALLSEHLVQRLAALVDLNSGLQVQGGADALSPESKTVRVDPLLHSCEQAVRALRALKDLGKRATL
ncbi:hydroxyacylglutathione hydrolase [Batrachochytrium salamandrivorans]|nr:hydroxyacylglutathione hydrolase [Batrachochytrium salamandrivorans]